MKTPAKHAPRLKKPKLVKVRFDLMTRLAHEVFLAGDFNHWNPNALPLKREDGGHWTIDVYLEPGAHEYLFVVDGFWETDPGADSAPNPFGTRNSVVHVAVPKRPGSNVSEAAKASPRTLFRHNTTQPQPVSPVRRRNVPSARTSRQSRT